MIVIVPNYLSEAIYEKVDEQLAKWPQFKPERESIYSDILTYFDEHGAIPDFDLQPIPAQSSDHRQGDRSFTR